MHYTMNMVYNFYSSLLNRIISFLLAFSLLAVTFTFAVDENVKQEFSVLYRATSICEYYNSLTNLSYDIINKVLKSANVNISFANTKTNTTKNKKTNKKNSRFDFVQPNNENSIKNLTAQKLSLTNIVFVPDNLKFYSIENYTLVNNIFILFFILLSFCYFARGNIDDNINFYNRTKENRLV